MCEFYCRSFHNLNQRPMKDYDGGAHCFQTITITVNGKSTQAQITDEVCSAKHRSMGSVVDPRLCSALGVPVEGLTSVKLSLGSSLQPARANYLERGLTVTAALQPRPHLCRLRLSSLPRAPGRRRPPRPP
jgi:hypothetical protein